MSVYSYPKGSLIQKVTSIKTEGGSERLYLEARADATPEQLTEIMCGLAKQGLQCIPTTVQNRPALQVRGFGRDKKVIATLAEHHWTEGAHTYEPDKEKAHNFKDTLRKRSLMASGAAYVVGDLCFTRYGYKEGSKLDVAAGILYGAGTLSALVFGRKDQSDIQIRDLATELTNYLKKEGGNLSKDCSLDAIVEDKHKGKLKHADDFLRRYPSELLNMFFAAAGICIGVAAYKTKVRGTPSERAIGEKIVHVLNKTGKTVDRAEAAAIATKEMHREGWLDIGLGSMTLASGLVAAFTPEKVIDPDAPKKTGIAGVKDFIQQKPLAIAGVGYLISTMCHAVSTTIAWRGGDSERAKSIPWRAGFVMANLIAEVLLAISSKGHGEGVVSDKSVDKSIISLAAEYIVKQPAKLQPILIKQVADFLGHPEILALKNDDVTKQLQTQVAAMRKNPWALAQHTAPEEAKVVVDKQDTATLPSWKIKAIQSKATPTQPLAGV